uniref:OTU domain-containing protein n=1 Tax=Ditylum brightwellii TaxID=49249 RepID=A0A7S4REW0_9STRA
MAKQRKKHQKVAKKGGRSAGCYEAVDKDDHRTSNNTRNNNAKGKKRGKEKGGKNGVRQFDDAGFRHTLEADGSKTIHDMAADGNCLFRSLSDQLYQDWGNRHDEVRRDVCSFLEENEDDFAVFLLLDEDENEDVADFKHYVARMREEGEWGGNVELAVAARLYQRNILVFSVTGAFSLESGHERTSGPDLLISFHEDAHYNSVRDNNAAPPKIRPRTDDETISSFRNSSRIKKNDLSRNRKNDQNESSSSPKEKKDETSTTTEPVKKRGKNGGGSNDHHHQQQQRNGSCPCGSSLRYKKCCLAKEKTQKRLAKFKEKNRLDEADHMTDYADIQKNDDESVHGNFKVLRI